MARLTSIASVALVALAAAGCATVDRQSARNDTRAMFAETATEANSHAYEVAAIANMKFGDRYIAANALERSVDAYPQGVGARLNMANAYANTGRLRESAAIFQTLITDGQFRYSKAPVGPSQPGVYRRFNVAEESARRLADLNQRIAFAAYSPTTTGAISATDVGTPVAAIVGGRTVSGRISDTEAFALDEANPAAQ